MRVNPNLVPDILAGLQQSQSTLNAALEEISTGKSVNVPSDNPAAASEMVQNTIETANVDQYTQNVTGVLSKVQASDSALSSVVSSLTQAISLGTEGANGTNSAANQQAIASQVQGILSSVVSAANTSYQGSYLFGGTANSQQPYTADPSSPTGYTYNGNSGQNSVAIGDSTSVQVNLPGSQIFSNSTTSVTRLLERSCHRTAERKFRCHFYGNHGREHCTQLCWPAAGFLRQCREPVKFAGNLSAAGNCQSIVAADVVGWGGHGPGCYHAEPGGDRQQRGACGCVQGPAQYAAQLPGDTELDGSREVSRIEQTSYPQVLRRSFIP